MTTEDKARKRNTTRHEEKHKRPVSISLDDDQLAAIDALRKAKKPPMNRSELVRWLLLEATKGE